MVSRGIIPNPLQARPWFPAYAGMSGGKVRDFNTIRSYRRRPVSRGSSQPSACPSQGPGLRRDERNLLQAMQISTRCGHGLRWRDQGEALWGSVRHGVWACERYTRYARPAAGLRMGSTPCNCDIIELSGWTFYQRRTTAPRSKIMPDRQGADLRDCARFQSRSPWQRRRAPQKRCATPPSLLRL